MKMKAAFTFAFIISFFYFAKRNESRQQMAFVTDAIAARIRSFLCCAQLAVLSFFTRVPLASRRFFHVTHNIAGGIARRALQTVSFPGDDGLFSFAFSLSFS